MKRIIGLIFIFAVFVFGVFVLRNLNWKNVRENFVNQKIYFEKNSGSGVFDEWREDDLLVKINNERESKGLSKLSISAKLNQAARARLAVVLEENDVDGSVTGISREKALQNAGYEASLVGDLVLVGFFRSNDPIAYWNSIKVTKDTLLHQDFREIGFAIKNTDNQVDIYAMLAAPRKVVRTVTPKITWGGPELWTEINKRRVEYGVNPLKQMNIMCTIASIRLNQILELGKLDGHAGFVPVLERQDIKSQAEKYNISEFLIQGYNTPAEAVAAWENTMGHKILLSGGEYVWGCVYSQNTFGVAIAAY